MAGNESLGLWNLSRLRFFLEAAESLSFSKAAARLRVSQPAVSRQIKELEGAVGVRLFERVGRGMALTEAGYTLLTHARRVREALEELEADMSAMHGTMAGTLLLGASTVWEYLLPNPMGSFKAAHPRVSLSLAMGNSAQVMDMLGQNKIHLAFVGEPPHGGDFDPVFEMEDEIAVVAAPDHRLAQSGPIAPGRLIGEPFVLREPESATAHAATRYLEGLGVSPVVALELGGHEAVKAAVRAGFGLGMVSTHAVRHELASGALARVQLQAPPCKRPLFVLRRRSRPYSPVQKAFVSHLAGGLGAGARA